MVIHTFAFRWKPGVTEEQRQRVIDTIRSLQGRIPGLEETWVGVNFSNREALGAYGGHPAHQELLAWLMPLILPMEVDFEA
jgi:hypothetical protein